MNKECLKNLVKNVDAHLFEIVNNLICSICQELFNKPVTTPCGHSFCNGCIKRVLSSKNNSGCPLCKNPIKRYGLEADEVKSTFGEICKELPIAFEQDVKELTSGILDFGEDLRKSSKLSQLHNQESVKETKTQKQKLSSEKKVKKAIEPVQSENDSESFCPVLKRGKNVQEYASAKRKRMDDLVSISQTEPTSNSSLYEPVDVIKKLEKIEKIPPEEKIQEWFNAVGDNIYINSPGFSIPDTNSKNESDCEKKEERKSTMIRRDYHKSGVSCKTEASTTVILKDPYEFVPSQNNKTVKKKRQKRSTFKKIPGFKALQNFSKENVKRNTLLLDTSREEACPQQETENLQSEKQITASQKFDQLLLESKEETKKTHILYSASQSSSPRFLDVSLKSRADSSEIKNTPKVSEDVNCAEGILFKNMESLTGRRQGRGSARSKRRRSLDTVKRGKRQKLFEVVSEDRETEEMVQESLDTSFRVKAIDFPPTKLEELLKELLDDDIIYATRPANAPVRLPELLSPQKPQPDVTQNTELIGFCTQEECPDVKKFKQVVENLERELNSNESIVVEPTPKKDCRSPVEQPENVNVDEALLSADENGNCNQEMWKRFCVEFLHLGKLTPFRKRAKSTVVKVVFPIGLSSLARRRGIQTNYLSPGQAPRKQTRQVSTGIQTTQQQPVSCVVQTSQVQHSSAMMQTTQEVKPSVEIQTTQRCNACAGVQTTQRLVCREIQTTQIGYESAQVQTTQFQLSQVVQVPPERPLRQHKKIIKRKSGDADSLYPSFAYDDEPPPEREVLMDFDMEEEFKKTWQNTQKHDRLVELKNQKNKEQNEKLSIDSDDSDIRPPKRRTFRILSQDSEGILEDYETRQLVPLDVQKVQEDEEMEVIELDTPKTQNSDEQVLKVLKNIDLDLPKGKSTARNEKSEESDSDFFVEQTPPRPPSRATGDNKKLSKASCKTLGFTQKQPSCDIERNDNLEGIDLIGDSLPKGFSESFHLLTSAPKSSQKYSKEEVFGNLPDENDQNQINASEDNDKASQVKAVVDAWRRSDPPPPAKASSQKRLCILASSVKNPETIGKFVNKFKGEFLSKPTKDVTHLIVGLHENEDKELLPLCTPKLLFAMANKKWVVSELWVESCLKANKILPEDSFEVLDPVGGNGCKRARTSTEKLLRNCEICFLGDFQTISREEFADLITECGGTLVSSPERFSYLPSKLRMIIADQDCIKLTEKQLQELYRKHSTVILSRDVIIMSIQSYELVSFSSYLLHSAPEESLLKFGYPSNLARNEESEDTSGRAR